MAPGNSSALEATEEQGDDEHGLLVSTEEARVLYGTSSDDRNGGSVGVSREGDASYAMTVARWPKISALTVLAWVGAIATAVMGSALMAKSIWFNEEASSAFLLEAFPRWAATTLGLVGGTVRPSHSEGQMTAAGAGGGVERRANKPCSFYEMSSLEARPRDDMFSFMRSADGLPLLVDGEGNSHALMNFRNSQRWFPRFRCGPEYEKWVQRYELHTPDGCGLQLPARQGSGGPFKPGAKVLALGNSYMMQTTNALFQMYESEILSTKGGAGNIIPGDVECGCLSGKVGIKKCIQTNWRHGQFSGHDGYTPNMKGLPDRQLQVNFKNGATMYVITNHHLLHEPKFGLEAIAQSFQFKLSEIDVVMANTGNPVNDGHLKHVCTEVDPDFDWAPYFKAREYDSQDKAVYALSLPHIHRQLSNVGFRGELIISDRGAAVPVPDELLDLVKEGAFTPGASPFTTKLVPEHMRFVSTVPMHFGTNEEKECFCPNLRRNYGVNTSLSAECQTAYVGENICNPHQTMEASLVPNAWRKIFHGHSCEPGLADVGAAMLVHSLWTPAEALRPLDDLNDELLDFKSPQPFAEEIPRVTST